MKNKKRVVAGKVLPADEFYWGGKWFVVKEIQSLIGTGQVRIVLGRGSKEMVNTWDENQLIEIFRTTT